MRQIDATLAAFGPDTRFSGEVSGRHLAPDEDPRLHAYVMHFEAARSVTAGPGMPALLNGFGRRLRPLLGDPGWQSITIGNPARAFAFRPAA